MNEKLKELYDNLVKDGYELPSFDQFALDMKDSSKASQLYNTISTDGYELPAFEQFYKDIAPSPVSSAQPQIASPQSQVSTEKNGAGFQNFKTYAPQLKQDFFDAIGMVNRGFYGGVSSLLKIQPAIEDAIFPSEVPPLALPGIGSTRGMGEALDKLVEEWSPVTPEFEQSTTGQVLQGVGQVALMAATSGAGSGGAAPAALTQSGLETGVLPIAGQIAKKTAQTAASPVGAMGGVMTAVPEWEAAKAQGLNDEEAFNILVKNYLVGQTEAIPIENVLGRLNKITNNSLINALKSMGTGGFEEGIQEGIQTYLTNQIASSSYDPDRDPMFQVLESAKIGGLVGLILPGVGAAMQSAPTDTQQKLTQKIIDLSSNDAIAEADTGDQNLNLEIDKAAELDETQKQTIENAVQIESPTTLPIQPKAESSQEVREGDTQVNVQEPPGEKVSPQEPVNLSELAKEFNDSGILLGKPQESVAETITEGKSESRAVVAEQVADFLREKGVTSEAQVNEFVDEFNALPVEGKPTLKIADAKRAYELLATPKTQPFNGETVERTINEELKRLSQERAKGKTEGTRVGQEFKNTMVEKVQEAMKESNLTPKQINSILTKIRRTNAFTSGSVSKLRGFIDKVMTDANYADTVDMAYSLRSQIKKQAKSKTIPQNIRNTAKNFARLDLENFESVEDYNQLAQHITSGLSSPKTNKYSGFDEFKVTDKINQARAAQEKAQLAQMLDDFGAFDVDNILLDDTSIEETLKANEAKREEIMAQLSQRADTVKESLKSVSAQDLTADERATLNTLANADLSKMNAADLISYVRIGDNIAINEDFSGSGVMEAKIEAERVAKNLLELPRNNKEVATNIVTAGTADFYSIGQLMDAMINNQQSVSDMEEMTGIAGIFEGGSNTNNVTNDKIEEFKDFVKSVNKKYKGKPDISHIEEQWKMVILKELARNTDELSHLPKVKANLEQTIRLYSKIDPKLSKKMQEYYDQYKNVLSSTEAVERFQKNDPQIHEAWQWFRNNMFNDSFAAAAKSNANNMYNQALVPENNYLPSSQKRISRQVSSAEEDKEGQRQLLTLKPQQAKNTLRATRSLGQGNGYDLNVFGSLFKAYHNVLYDINSAKHIQLLYEVSKRPEFSEVVGGEENKNKLVSSLEKRLADQRGDNVSEGNFVKLFNNVAHILKDLGVAKALGGFDQIVTQTIPTWISASINLGADANLMFTTIPKSFTKDVIGKSRTSEAGKRKGGTDLGESAERYLSEDIKGGVKLVEDIRRGVKGASDFTLIPLVQGDLFVRRHSFAAFYTQNLISQGIDPKTIDLSKEGEKQNEPERRKARAYADHMIATLQVPSNRAEMGEFLTRRGGWDALRTILFPFSVFPVNTKIRFTRAVNKLSTNPSEGTKELAGVVAESITFGAIKTYFLAAWVYPMIQTLIRMGFGLEEPEKEEDRSGDFWASWLGDNPDVVKNFRKLSTSVYNDIVPTSIGPGAALTSYMTNYGGYAFRGEEYQDHTYDEWLAETRGLVNQPYESEFSNWGVLGVGTQQLKDIGDAWYDMAATASGEDVIYYNTVFGTQEAEVEGVEDLIYWNALLEAASIVTPREFDAAWKKVYQEQLKDYTPDEKRTLRQREKRRSTQE